MTVRGAEAWTVPRAIADITEEGRVDYDGDGFAVVVIEQFFYRNLSSLQTTLVFDLVDDTTCEVTLVVGGAAAGLAKYDADAEGTAIRDLVRELEAYCRRHDLEFERH